MKVFNPTLYREDKGNVSLATVASARPCFKVTHPGSNTDSVVSLVTSVAPNLTRR